MIGKENKTHKNGNEEKEIPKKKTKITVQGYENRKLKDRLIGEEPEGQTQDDNSETVLERSIMNEMTNTLDNMQCISPFRDCDPSSPPTPCQSL